MSTELIVPIDPAILNRLKHPEWIVMALNGVTPEQLAPLVRRQVSEVRRYLYEFARAHETIWAGRILVHDQPRPRPSKFVDRDRFWRWQLHESMAFVLRYGRRPRCHASDEHEMRLGQWITAQRSDENVGKLPGHRRRWLNEGLPDWRRSDRELADEQRWHENVRRLTSHRRRTGAWPKAWKTSDDERRLAHWLQGQRRREQDGVLSSAQILILDRAASGWRG